MEVYETVKLIGSGAFGQVYLVRHKREDKLYVNKKIKTRDMSQKDRENTENEVRLLQKLRHSNIVAYKDSYMDREQFLNIVMIHCEGGDMHNKIKNQKGKNFPEDQIQDWLAQMALALFYLHEKKILHRDLKTQNIFLKHDRVRLGDFGIAKVLDSTREFANTCIGTPYYMSPELFKYKPYSYKSDVWAFGCVLYEMCNLRHAFDANSLNGLAVKIMNGSYPPINQTYSKGMRELIAKMLQLNPKNRPSIVDILNVSFVKRKVVTYISEILSGNYPEANLINDVDDVYADSLRDEASKLGLMKLINQVMTKGPQAPLSQEELQRPPRRTSSRTASVNGVEKAASESKVKRELQKQINEKARIEQEIQRLEKKRMVRSSSSRIAQQSNQQQQSQQQQQPPAPADNNRQNFKRAGVEGDQSRKERGDRSYSHEREGSVNRRKVFGSQQQQQQSQVQSQQQIPTPTQSKSSVYSIRNEVKKVRQQTDSASTTSTAADSETSSQSQSTPASRSKQVKVSGPNSVGQSAQSSQAARKEASSRLEQEKQRRIEQEEEAAARRQFESQQAASAAAAARTRLSRAAATKQQSQQQQLQQQQQQQQRESQQYDEDDNNNNNYNNNNKHNSNITKRGSMQSLDAKKARDAAAASNMNAADEFSLDLIERESFDQKMNYSNEQFDDPSQMAFPQQQQSRPSRQIKIQEDLAMDDEIDDDDEDEDNYRIIQEEENEESGAEEEEEEEDVKKIEEKLEMMRTRLKEKTMKINTMTQALNQSRNMTSMQRSGADFTVEDDGGVDFERERIPEEEEDDNAYYDNEPQAIDEENEDDYNENDGEVILGGGGNESNAINNPQYFKIQDRIKLFRHRCEASLGMSIFEKAHSVVKANLARNAPNNEELRKQLVAILSEENIGFWHLIDQILFLEDLASTIPQFIEKQ